MAIEANLLVGFYIGVGVGVAGGLLIGAALLVCVGKYVKLPW